MTELSAQRCKPCEGGVAPLTRDQALGFLEHLDGWQLNEAGIGISKRFPFQDYYQTMAFVNTVAWISHQEDHHPVLEVHWGHCEVRYTTHAIQGLSENDFICAAKVDRLFAR
jgi:4a-hydroxytetrahydrobiopterin dehydratase